MNTFKNALLSLMMACILCAVTPISGLAAAEATTPVQTPALVEEDAPVITESDQSTTEPQNTVCEHVKHEHEHMQEYIAWSQAQWAAHIDRTINFWHDHYHTDAQTESTDDDAKHPFMGSDMSDHIRQSADRLVDHIEQSEQRLLDNIKRSETRAGNTEESK